MFTLEEIIKATGGGGLCPAVDRSIMVSGVSTDSRTAQAGQLFVPLKGDKFDGHDYLSSIFAKGVRVALANGNHSGVTPPEGSIIIYVNDTLRALGDLAAFHRKRFDIPVVGITGSNGKTTTKEMLASILSLGGNGLKTSGNLNNLIGLPQMIFQLNESHRWAVLEMGMSEFGEIDRLAEIGAPQVGVITNAFPAHLASMGSVEGVAKAKGELFLRLSAGGTAICNADDQFISKSLVPEGVRRCCFGLHDGEFQAENIDNCGNRGQSFTIKCDKWQSSIMLHAFGSHNIYNALAAAAAADALGIPQEQIARGLADFKPYDKRFNLQDLGPVILIDDSYNSNPASTCAALLTLRSLKGEKRAVAILGDMLELGEEGASAHFETGHLAATCADRLYLFGDLGELVAKGAIEAGMAEGEVLHLSSHEAIVDDIVKDHLDGDYILVKGSRGMRMDLVSTSLREIFSSPDYKPRRG